MGDRPEWDMYNLTTGEWTQGNLSASRMRLEAGSVMGKAYFVSGMGSACGAFCPVVDIFDTTTGIWSAQNLTRGRYEFSVASLDERYLLVTGGKQNGTSTGGKWDLVETLDAHTGTDQA